MGFGDGDGDDEIVIYRFFYIDTRGIGWDRIGMEWNVVLSCV